MSAGAGSGPDGAQRLGLAGALTRAFINSPLTPLLLIAAFACGLIAPITLPREEEPQISVPMVDIHVRADGLKAEDAVKLVSEPLETIVKGIPGVEHVYSRIRDEGAVVTARFLVGTSADAAILRVHEKIRANLDRIPVGLPEPLIVGRGIDDDAIVVIENVARHWALREGRNRMQAAIDAVAEVGNPTIVATLTVVAALLPMLFVSGLMGP